MQIMKLLKIQRVSKDLVLFDQGEPGDKFYIILKGTVGVEIAMRKEVELTKTNPPSLKVKQYLQHLFDNFDAVFWPRVPYAIAVRKYLYDVKQAKKVLQEVIEDEIYAKLGKKIVSMFQWAQQKKQQKLGRTLDKGLEEQELLARRASRYAKALRGQVGNGTRNMDDEAQQVKESAAAGEDHTPVDRVHDGKEKEELNPVQLKFHQSIACAESETKPIQFKRK